MREKSQPSGNHLTPRPSRQPQFATRRPGSRLCTPELRVAIRTLPARVIIPDAKAAKDDAAIGNVGLQTAVELRESIQDSGNPGSTAFATQLGFLRAPMDIVFGTREEKSPGHAGLHETQSSIHVFDPQNLPLWSIPRRRHDQDRAALYQDMSETDLPITAWHLLVASTIRNRTFPEARLALCSERSSPDW